MKKGKSGINELINKKKKILISKKKKKTAHLHL
jgi:hypothetical protein